MSRIIRVGVAQCRTLSNTTETLASLESFAREAMDKNVGLVLFPEAFLGGYPRNCTFGTSIGSREPEGREQFLNYYNAAIDLGDTQAGAGEAWAKKDLPLPKGLSQRGDGTREDLERIAHETGVFLVVGVIEKSAGSLFCSVVFVSPEDGMLANKRRKVMPTGAERLVWAQGSTDTLKAVSTTIQGVQVNLGCAICWENYMPLLRYSLYAQDVNIWLAPTADSRDTWLSLMQTIAFEGRNFVLSCNQVTRRNDLPSWAQSSTATSPPQPVKPSIPTERVSRRLSRVTTHEGHEICWIEKPLSEQNGTHTESNHEKDIADESKPQNRKLSILKTDSGHELCLPIYQESELQGSEHDVFEEEEVSPTQKPSDLSKVASQTAITNGGQSSVPELSNKAFDNDFVSRGGSCIISPFGQTMKGPVFESEGLQIAEVDLDDCVRGKLDFDVAGHYARSDSFKLTVKGLEQTFA